MTSAISLLCGIVSLAWLTGFWMFWRIRTCEETSRHDPPAPLTGGSFSFAEMLERKRAQKGRVSIIIPARNEEFRLPMLLESLASQEVAADEIIVVDDHSTDDTIAVARRYGVRLIKAPELPAGWMGKPWACWNGALASTGDTLIFLDADTWLLPRGIARLVAEHKRLGGLLSVQPFHVTEEPYERLSAIFNISLMMSMNIFTPLGRLLRPDGAFGPCMVFSRDDYFTTGGHREVSGAILEDFFLGKLFAKKGLAVNCIAGRGTISFRMYPEGFGQMVAGWSKTFGSGSIGTAVPTLGLIIFWMAGAFAATGLPVLALAMDPPESPLTIAFAASLYVAYAFQFYWMLRRIGEFGGLTAALYFIPLYFYAIIFARSLVLMVFVRRISWKGREVATCVFREERAESHPKPRVNLPMPPAKS